MANKAEPGVDPLHRVPFDARPFYREEIAEALDGTITQLSGALSFLERGYDDEIVRQAMIRARDLFKRGIDRMNELHAENKRRRPPTIRSPNLGAGPDRPKTGSVDPAVLPTGMTPAKRVEPTA